MFRKLRDPIDPVQLLVKVINNNVLLHGMLPTTTTVGIIYRY